MRNAIILGSGRSGTSMLSGTLAESGYDCGPDPYAPRDSNPKGFFESPAINNINEALVAQVQGASEPQDPGQRWLSKLAPPVTFQVAPPVAAAMQQLTERSPFCFKDPRFCYTLDAWAPYLKDALRLCIFRDPSITAESILKECASQPYLQSLAMTFDRAVSVWTAMYRFVLDVHQHRGDWLFLHCDQVLRGDGLDQLEKNLGISLSRGFPESRLQRTRSSRPVPDSTSKTFNELCERAGWNTGANPSRVAPSLPRGWPPPTTLQPKVKQNASPVVPPSA